MKQIIEHNVNGVIIYTYWKDGVEHLITKEDADAEAAADPDNVKIMSFAQSIVGLAKEANNYKVLLREAYLKEYDLNAQMGLIYDMFKDVAPDSEFIQFQARIKSRIGKPS